MVNGNSRHTVMQKDPVLSRFDMIQLMGSNQSPEMMMNYIYQ